MRELQIAEIVTERAAHQEFHRQVVKPLRPGCPVALFRLEHAVDQAIANRQRQGAKNGFGTKVDARLRERVTDMFQNRLPEFVRRRKAWTQGWTYSHRRH